MSDWNKLANVVACQLVTLSKYSEEEDALTRPTLSVSHKAASEQIAEWMEAAGMAVLFDHAGNVIGRTKGKSRDAPIFLIGSHIDTVTNAGIYDGNLGVVAPIAIVSACREKGISFPFTLDVIAFSDEEGNRFPDTLTGSKSLSGTLSKCSLDMTDTDGISRAEALKRFGCDPAKVGNSPYLSEEVLGYFEIHIEQGPVLVNKDLPVGVVTGIHGAQRYTFKLKGCAGHAGTVPMNMRRDALAAAAEMITAIENEATKRTNVVATVGSIKVAPGVRNVIAGEVNFSLDLRSSESTSLRLLQEKIFAMVSKIASARSISATWTVDHRTKPTPCDEKLTTLLEQSIIDSGINLCSLASGAGHDAISFAELCPISMLFVRCSKGISHHPNEDVLKDDIAIALQVTDSFLRKIARLC